MSNHNDFNHRILCFFSSLFLLIFSFKSSQISSQLRSWQDEPRGILQPFTLKSGNINYNYKNQKQEQKEGTNTTGKFRLPWQQVSKLFVCLCLFVVVQLRSPLGRERQAPPRGALTWWDFVTWKSGMWQKKRKEEKRKERKRKIFQWSFLSFSHICVNRKGKVLFLRGGPPIF